MKLAVADLKKAIQWIEANSRDLHVRLERDPNDRHILIKCEDKYQVQIEIKIFAESNMSPRIRKEDAL